tara:strand:+ start:1552 stop:1929 length:378 start_codon:yes stop_codon:yes gene_type:complete
MANQYKGEITGKLGDKERTFRLTFESIVNIENRTGKSILDITNSMGQNNYSLKDVVIVMHEALQGAGGKFIQSAVGDMVMKTGLMKVAILCSEILMTVFTGEKTQEDSPLVQGENEQQNTQSSNT